MDRCKPGWAEEGGRTAGRLVGAELEAAHCAHAAVLVVPLGQQLVERKIGELKQVIGERLGHSIGDGSRFAMGTAERFGNHVITMRRSTRSWAVIFSDAAASGTLAGSPKESRHSLPGK